MKEEYKRVFNKPILSSEYFYQGTTKKELERRRFKENLRKILEVKNGR